MEIKAETISACCHAPIRAYLPKSNFYSMSPHDPVSYCTSCGATDPEEIEAKEEDEQ